MRWDRKSRLWRVILRPNGPEWLGKSLKTVMEDAGFMVSTCALSGQAHVDAALAQLEKQKENPEAILELCQKAEAYKKKGNERLKEPLRSFSRRLREGEHEIQRPRSPGALYHRLLGLLFYCSPQLAWAQHGGWWP